MASSRLFRRGALGLSKHAGLASQWGGLLPGSSPFELAAAVPPSRPDRTGSPYLQALPCHPYSCTDSPTALHGLSSQGALLSRRSALCRPGPTAVADTSLLITSGEGHCRLHTVDPDGKFRFRRALSSAAHPGPGRPAQKSLRPEGVDHIIAVASGKGGVGKSTTAVNLAAALAHSCGLRVGVLDADVYGPSLPRLLQLHGHRPQMVKGPDGRPRMVGLSAYGLTCMSMGFLMDEDAAAVWRGPMVMSALEQMLWGTQWGPLDVLVVDMPPGTGDAQLTMAQRAGLSGVVMVSTPQDLALLDAKRGAIMFRKVKAPILGLIENMSYFVCPCCGERTEIFSHGGARETAKAMDMEFLGEIPLQTRIRQLSDSGRPLCVADPDSEIARVYGDIAKRLWHKLQAGQEEGSHERLPSIVME